MWPYTAQEVEELSGPRGELALKTLARPADAGPAGDISEGWIMRLMEAAGNMAASRHAGGRVVSASAAELAFHAPVKTGDVLTSYADLARIEDGSAVFHIEVWAMRSGRRPRVKVGSSDIAYLSLDKEGDVRPFAANTN